MARNGVENVKILYNAGLEANYLIRLKFLEILALIRVLHAQFGRENVKNFYKRLDRMAAPDL